MTTSVKSVLYTSVAFLGTLWPKSFWLISWKECCDNTVQT